MQNTTCSYGHQGAFKEDSGKIQGRFREHSVRVKEDAQEFPIPTARSTERKYKDLCRIQLARMGIREHSRKIQGELSGRP
jgi:hypothetical protein